MELNAEQIKKALEYCKWDDMSLCKQCPYHKPSKSNCISEMSADALALIEELLDESEDRDNTISSLIATIKDIRADTAKKMQERLTTFFSNDDFTKYCEVDAYYINEQINRIAKEIIKGESKGHT